MEYYSKIKHTKDQQNGGTSRKLLHKFSFFCIFIHIGDKDDPSEGVNEHFGHPYVLCLRVSEGEKLPLSGLRSRGKAP
jgi:hypothetical protein